MSAEFSNEIPLPNFLERLRERQPAAGAACEAPDWQQWLQYWDDEESLGGNLRNFEHWLQRKPARA